MAEYTYAFTFTKKIFFLNMAFQNKYSKYKTLFGPKNYLYLKKHINKIKTMTKKSLFETREGIQEARNPCLNSVLENMTNRNFLALWRLRSEEMTL